MKKLNSSKIVKETWQVQTGSGSGDTIRYTVPEVARLLGISERAVRKRIDVGSLKAVREGRGWTVLLQKPTGSGTFGGTSTVPGAEPSEPGGIIEPERMAQQMALVQELVAQAVAPIAAQLERQVERNAALERENGALDRDVLHERERREQAERERDDLRARLDAREASVRPAARSTSSEGHREANVAPGAVQRDSEASARSRSSWWRRFFFGEE